MVVDEDGLEDFEEYGLLADGGPLPLATGEICPRYSRIHVVLLTPPTGAPESSSCDHKVDKP